ncbi:hypothetical protein JD969_01325 [Planctomycetota bacterium]|nr:hypothetical protein JD969_01325 [Planctomycetota bacterium]
MSTYLKLSVLVVTFSLLVMTGCGEEAVKPYYAPKDPPHVSDHSGHGHATIDEITKGETGKVDEVKASGDGIVFKSPENWVREENFSSMLDASYLVGDGGRVTVSSLRGDGGGELANLNRWRGQIGLTPVASMSEQKSQTITVDGQEAKVYYLGNEKSGQAILIASIANNAQGKTWYIKMTGKPEVISQNASGFTEFLKTIQF